MFEHPPYVWMPTCMIGHPMFALPHMFGCLLYVWVPSVFGYPSVWLDALHMFGCPPVHLDAARCMGASKGMRDIQTYRGIQMYGVHMDTPSV